MLRHRPQEVRLRREFQSLAEKMPAVFNAYQQTQTPKSKKQMLKASHVAAFIGHKPLFAVFVGLYQMAGSQVITRAQLEKKPNHQALTAYDHQVDPQVQAIRWFDLQPLEVLLPRMEGSAHHRMAKTRNCCSRWATGEDRYAVSSILDESMFARKPLHWMLRTFSWEDIQDFSQAEQQMLTEYPAIYYIYDVTLRKRLRRLRRRSRELGGTWTEYAATGHGGNTRLKKCKPKNLLFSILERLPEDTLKEELLKRESEWKERLHTRGHGSNCN